MALFIYILKVRHKSNLIAAIGYLLRLKSNQDVNYLGHHATVCDITLSDNTQARPISASH